MKTTANAIPHWETATYKPSISDLERSSLSFLPCRIAIFFPQAQPKSRTNAILTVTSDLDENDLEEVMLHAQFRKARQRARGRR